MKESMSRARALLDASRGAARRHIGEWRNEGPGAQRDALMAKILTAQAEIARIKGDHPPLDASAREDHWVPEDGALGGLLGL